MQSNIAKRFPWRGPLAANSGTNRYRQLKLLGEGWKISHHSPHSPELVKTFGGIFTDHLAESSGTNSTPRGRQIRLGARIGWFELRRLRCHSIRPVCHALSTLVSKLHGNDLKPHLLTLGRKWWLGCPGRCAGDVTVGCKYRFTGRFYCRRHCASLFFALQVDSVRF